MSLPEHLLVQGLLLALALSIYALGVRRGRADLRASRVPAKAEGLIPFAMRPDQVRTGFDQVRSAIPVDDEELGRAKPARIIHRA